MKINFDASFRDIQTTIGAPARPAQSIGGSPAFGKLLESVSPSSLKQAEVQKISEKTKTAAAPRQAKFEGEGPMASFRFPAPETRQPALAPLSPPEPPVTEAAESVKTPAVLGARRLTSSRSTLVQRMAVVRELVGEAGRNQGIDPALGMSVVATESAFDPQAISKDGFQSKGLFQLLDTTGARMRERLGLKEGYDPYDPDQNIRLGIGYLRYLHDIFSNNTAISDRVGTSAAANSSSLEKLAVAAFNAGEGRVAAAQRRAERAGGNPGVYEDIERYLPEITQDYVRKVLLAKVNFDGMYNG